MNFMSMIQWIASGGIIGFVGYKVYQAIKSKDVISDEDRAKRDKIMGSLFGKPKPAEVEKKLEKVEDVDVMKVMFGENGGKQ